MTPTIAVCFPTLNENTSDLIGTLESLSSQTLRPDVTYIGDDASAISPYDALHIKANPYYMRHIGINFTCNRVREGEGRFRQHLWEWHRSDDFQLHTDAHMRFPPDTLERFVEASRQHPDSIFCAQCCDFEPTRLWFGGTLTHTPGHFFGVGWITDPSVFGDDPYPIIPCVHGATYWIPRHIGEAMGGITPGHHGFGETEVGLALRASLCGFDCRLMRGLTVAHNFKHSQNRTPAQGAPVTPIERIYNREVIARTVLNDWKTWTDDMAFRRDPESHAKILAMLEKNADEIASVREHLQANRKQSDKEIGRALKIPL